MSYHKVKMGYCIGINTLTFMIQDRNWRVWSVNTDIKHSNFTVSSKYDLTTHGGFFSGRNQNWVNTIRNFLWKQKCLGFPLQWRELPEVPIGKQQNSL